MVEVVTGELTGGVRVDGAEVVRAPLQLAPGAYYWDGRALWPGARRAAAERPTGSSSAVWAAAQTLTVCGGASGLLALLTSGLEVHPTLIGIGHAIALVPVLLIDPVYRWLLRNGLPVAEVQRLVANWWAGPHARVDHRPWLLSAVLYAAGIAILSEAFVASPVDAGVWGDLLILGGLGLVTGFMARRASRRRSLLTLLTAVTLGLLAWYLVVDPAYARMAHQVGFRLQGPGDLLAVFTLFCPFYLVEGVAGLWLARLSIRLWPWREHAHARV